MRSRPFLAAVAVATVAACAPASEPDDAGSPPAASAPALDGTEWVLAALGGRPPVPGTRVTLELQERSAGGYGGCNWYGGVYRADGGFVVDSVMSTMRACIAEGVTEQESAYLAALARVREARRAGERLELADSAGTVLLAFTRRPPLPMDPAALVGTRWRLRGGDAAPTPPDTTATLRLADSTASGHAGCRDYTGTYTATGDRIRFTSLAMAGTECPRGEAALRREEAFTTVLSEAVNYRLAGDTLELIVVDGRSLLFGRER